MSEFVIFGDPFSTFFLDEVGMRALAWFIDVVWPLLEAKPAHWAHKHEGQSQGVDVKLKRVEVFVFGLSDVFKELWWAVLNSGELNGLSFLVVEVDDIIKVTKQVGSFVVEDIFRFDISVGQVILLHVC